MVAAFKGVKTAATKMAAAQTPLPAAAAVALLKADDPEEVLGVTINDEPWACDGGEVPAGHGRVTGRAETTRPKSRRPPDASSLWAASHSPIRGKYRMPWAYFFLGGRT
jgi:hypothetical protein